MLRFDMGVSEKKELPPPSDVDTSLWARDFGNSHVNENLGLTGRRATDSFRPALDVRVHGVRICTKC